MRRYCCVCERWSKNAWCQKCFPTGYANMAMAAFNEKRRKENQLLRDKTKHISVHNILRNIRGQKLL